MRMACAKVKPAGTPQRIAVATISRRERPLHDLETAGCTTVTTGVYNAAVSSVAPPKAPPKPDWARLVSDSIKQHGMWHTFYKLLEARAAYPDDLSLRG